MRLPRLVIREIGYRRLNFVLALLSVVVAVGCLVGVLTVLRGHDIRTAATMAKLEDDIRKEMKRLGFNVRILPKGQNLEDLYARDYASKFMPEEYVHKLANSKIMTIRHLLPSLRQKIEWPEQNGRVVILVGVRGEVPLIHRTPKSPILHPVPPGSIVVGYLLHKGPGLEEGQTIAVLGKKFKVSKLQPQTGTKDDITLWVNLEEAQALLGKKGLINEIMALKCHCAGGTPITKVREEIQRILPDTQVVEFASTALARARARDAAAAAAAQSRRQLERFASWLVPLVLVASMVWVGFLAFTNVRERLPEIGVMRAIGLRSSQIFLLFISRAIILGFAGAVVGYGAGFFGGVRWTALPPSELFDPTALAVGVAIAPVLSALAAWLPATMAARQDPATILREI